MLGPWVIGPKLSLSQQTSESAYYKFPDNSIIVCEFDRLKKHCASTRVRALNYTLSALLSFAACLFLPRHLEFAEFATIDKL